MGAKLRNFLFATSVKEGANLSKRVVLVGTLRVGGKDTSIGRIDGAKPLVLRRLGIASRVRRVDTADFRGWLGAWFGHCLYILFSFSVD